MFQRAVENEPNGCSAITLWGPTTALTLPGKSRLAVSQHRFAVSLDEAAACTDSLSSRGRNKKGALIRLTGFEAGFL